MRTEDRRRTRRKLPEMEGAIARWYTRVRGSGSQLEGYRRQAADLAEALPGGAGVLEVAPGPGYFAVELARLGRFDVTGLDISHSFVEIATENARRAGVRVDFRQGDVAAIPFDADSFDLVVCQAAFKNFTAPGRALDEMYRVLRPGGTAVIQDMNREATGAEIAREVEGMGLGRVSAFMTRRSLGMLRRRAYSPAQFERLVADSAFRTCQVSTGGIGMEVWLRKPERA